MLSEELVVFAVLVPLIVLVMATPQPAMKTNGVAIPLARHSGLVSADETVHFDAFDSQIASVQTKFVRRTRHPALPGIQKRRNKFPLGNFGIGNWYATISVGTPSKTFQVLLDTGSSALFLPSASCDSSCQDHTLWDPTSSSTAKNMSERFQISYQTTGSVSGILFTDTVSLGGFTVARQTVGGATHYPAEFQRQCFPTDGMLGMGFLSKEFYGASPLMTTLFYQGQLASPSFSFNLSVDGGELYIGGANSELYTGDFTFAPVIEGKTGWLVKMDNIQWEDQVILTNVVAVIDTATNFIIGPVSQVSHLFDALGGLPVEDTEGYYTLPCAFLPTLRFSFGGKPFLMPPSMLSVGRTSPTSLFCKSTIVGMDTADDVWIVGGVFLQSVYTTFDIFHLQVGFAELAV